MLKIICLIFVIFYCTSIECSKEEEAKIIKSDYVNNGNKGYHFELESTDGVKRQEVGTFKYVGGLAVKGSYEYIGDDDQTYIIEYEADERGYRPSAPKLKS